MVKIICALFVIGLFGAAICAPDCSKPPAVHNIEKCCDFNQSNDEVDQKCEKLLANEPPAQGQIPEVCYAECIFNNTVFTNGKLDLSKVKPSLLKEKNADPNFLTVWEKAFETCNGKLNEIASKIPAPAAGSNRCKPYSELLLFCITGESVVNCPKNKWLDNTECNTIREYMKSCPLLK